MVICAVSGDLVNQSIGYRCKAIPLRIARPRAGPHEIADMLLTFASGLRLRSGITAAEQLLDSCCLCRSFHLDTRTLNVSLCLRMADEQLYHTSIESWTSCIPTYRLRASSSCLLTAYSIDSPNTYNMALQMPVVSQHDLDQVATVRDRP